ncbi:MAG TPA: carbon-nitrogen hydrolase family protein [Pseudomonadales bacterium]|nr:carbon-nitrogen hydrolase family protein [Pseudomonadales bacterium]
MTVIAVAVSQHPIVPVSSWQDFTAHAETQVRSAADAGAQLLVFAEYGSMGLVTLLDESSRATLAGQLAGLQGFAQDFSALYRTLAQRFSVWIVAPSFPFAIAEKHYVNRAWIAGPRGQLFFQDKIHMTRFETELFNISAASDLKVIDAGEFTFAVAICYDVEFPEQVRALAEAGADIIAVPSCTDSLHGFHRVLHCVRARAVENQCFVAQAPLTGEAPWCEAIDVNVGRAGVFAPVDRGFPEDGVLAAGHCCADKNWHIAACDISLMRDVRNDGQVLNWRDRQTVIRPAVRLC